MQYFLVKIVLIGPLATFFRYSSIIHNFIRGTYKNILTFLVETCLWECVLLSICTLHILHITQQSATTTAIPSKINPINLWRSLFHKVTILMRNNAPRIKASIFASNGGQRFSSRDFLSALSRYRRAFLIRAASRPPGYERQVIEMLTPC